LQHSCNLLFLKVNPNGKFCPRFNLTSLLNFTVLTLFNLIKILTLIVREIKINKSLLIFLLNFTKQIILTLYLIYAKCHLLFINVNPLHNINPRFNLIFSCDFTILTLYLIYAKCHLLFLNVNPWRNINPRFNLIFSCDFTILTLDLIYAKCHLLFLNVNPWRNINPRFNLFFRVTLPY